MTRLCEQCLEKLPPQAPGGGRRRRFCSDRCRQIARRRRLLEEQEPLAGATLTNAEIDDACREDLAKLSKDPEAALADALGLMLWAVGTFRKLGGQVSPRLAWRCRKMAIHIDQGLSEYFRP